MTTYDDDKAEQTRQSVLGRAQVGKDPRPERQETKGRSRDEIVNSSQPHHADSQPVKKRRIHSWLTFFKG